MTSEDTVPENNLISALLQENTRPSSFSNETHLAARLAILDSVGVGLGTLDHPAVVAAREYVRRHLPEGQAVSIWGGDGRSSVDGALIANTVPLRCYDINDVMHGESGQAGHPSDFIPGLMAVAEAEHLSGRELITSVIIAYDAAKLLFDVINVGKFGWDYANLVGLAAVTGFSVLLRLSAAQGAQALSIFAASHIGTNQLESGDLSESRNLTMWKRFNGADAVYSALRACRMASVGIEGPSYSLLGDLGFFRQQSQSHYVVERLMGIAQPSQHGVEITEFKKWPVGTRAQSAIAAAMDCREQLDAAAVIQHVDVFVEPGVIDHLVRESAWQPDSRETADHSLPYIVVIALLFGDVSIDHFNTDTYFHRADVTELLEKVNVKELPASEPGHRSAFPTRVSVIANGKEYVGTGQAPPENLRALAFRGQIDEKFIRLASRGVSNEQVQEVHRAILDLENMEDLTKLGSQLMAPRR